MKNKVAITANGFDFCRIIPFNMDDSGAFEIKITPFSSSVKIRSFKAFNECPILKTIKGNNEITYHVSSEKHNTKIHFKGKSSDSKSKFHYENLPLDKLVNIEKRFKFPIPLFKVFLPQNTLKKSYKFKKDHTTIDLEDNNYAEFYLIGNDSPFLSEEYAELDLLTLLMPISFEYLAHNSSPSDPTKQHFFDNLGSSEHKVMKLIKVNNLVSVLVVMYKSFDIDDMINLTFIENEYSKDILLLTQVRPGKPSKNINEYDSIYIKNVNIANIPPTFFGLARLKFVSSTLIEKNLRRNVGVDEKTLAEIRTEILVSQYRLKYLYFNTMS